MLNYVWFRALYALAVLISVNGFDFPDILRLENPGRQLRAAFEILSKGSETLASLGAAPSFFSRVSQVSATAANVLEERERLQNLELNRKVERKSGVIPDKISPVVYDAYLTHSGFDRWHISQIYHPEWTFQKLPGESHRQKAEYLIHALQNSLHHVPASDRVNLLGEHPVQKAPSGKNVTGTSGATKTAHDEDAKEEKTEPSTAYEQHLSTAKEAVEDLTEECLKSNPHKTVADCMKHLLLKHRSYFQFGEPARNVSPPLEPVLLKRIDFTSDLGFKVSLGNVHVFGISNGLTEDRLHISLLRYPEPYSSLGYLRFSMLLPSVTTHGLFNFDRSAMKLMFPEVENSELANNHVGFFRGNVRWVQGTGDGYILTFPDGSALATNVKMSFDFAEWTVSLRSRRNPDLSEKMTTVLNDRIRGKPLLDRLAIPIADSLASIFSQIFTDVFMASGRRKRPRAEDGKVTVHVDDPVAEKDAPFIAARRAGVQPNNATNGGLFDLESTYAELFGKFNSRNQWTWEEFQKSDENDSG